MDYPYKIDIEDMPLRVAEWKLVGEVVVEKHRRVAILQMPNCLCKVLYEIQGDQYSRLVSAMEHGFYAHRDACYNCVALEECKGYSCTLRLEDAVPA